MGEWGFRFLPSPDPGPQPGGFLPFACPYVLFWNGFLVPVATENLSCLCRHPLILFHSVRALLRDDWSSPKGESTDRFHSSLKGSVRGCCLKQHKYTNCNVNLQVGTLSCHYFWSLFRSPRPIPFKNAGTSWDPRVRDRGVLHRLGTSVVRKHYKIILYTKSINVIGTGWLRGNLKLCFLMMQL